ncbi:MAG: hypothetical protein CMM50_16570 [Rhodospirillaceae bacterium]|nr:hypothetical protein [Rhodospirillaceae bacterium]
MTGRVEFRCASKTSPDTKRRQSLLDIARATGVPIWCECGGKARCTTCRVRVVDGLANLAPRSAAEKRLASLRGWDPATRLACQTRVTGNVAVERLIRSGSEVSPLQVETVRAGSGDERQLAILFCDVRDFTTFAESHLSFDVVHVLNKLFAVLGEPILLNNGVIYQYVGDEITGLFGLEAGSEADSCRTAVRAALGMLAAVETLNDELESEFGARLAVGIGLHFGPVVIGRIGHPSHQQFGVVGDTINAASRIQEANKTLGTRFLASSPVVDCLPEGVLACGKSTTVTLRGRQEPVGLVEIRGFTTPDPVLIAQTTAGALLSRKAELTSAFYGRLFEAAPGLRPMFPANLEGQSEKLGQMLEVLVYALNRPTQLAMGLHSLGQRHVAYGVTAEHYAAVGPILLAAIGDILGDDFQPQVREAWAALIDTILQLMQRGAANAPD